MSYKSVSVDHLEENTWNPNVMDPETFEALKVDVVAGDYDPIIASPRDTFYGDSELRHDRYVIVDGAHRWRAVIEGEVYYINVDIRPYTEAEAKSYNYKKNWERGSMDPLKEAALFQSEVDLELTQEDIAKKYRRSRPYVANRLRLLNVSESVRDIYRDPEEGFKAVKKEELAADIVEFNPEEEYTADQVEEMVEAAFEEKKIVPRGTMTASHMEAVAVLPEAAQKKVAAKIVEENLTVRDTEKEVKLVQENTARRARFETALERAVQKTCPDCGAPPSFFEEEYSWVDGARVDSYDENRFECSKTSYHDWLYMKRAPSKTRQLAEAKKERSKKLSAARQNPVYIRRAEESDDLFNSMRPWVLSKIRQIESITRVSITGVRADGKVMEIDYPSGYGTSLYVQVSDDADKDGTLDWSTRRSFSFTIEKKDYKKLPFKSKLDCTASPEYRASIHHFLDHIIKTDLDPFLPEDEELVKDIMRKYGELEEEPEDLKDPDPHEELEAEEAEEPIPLEEEDKAGSEEIYNVIDKILDQILDNEHDRVKVDVTGIDAEDTVNYFEMRISARAITGNVEVYEGEDGEVYLERLKSKVEEVG